jgi:hypothetical protein
MCSVCKILPGLKILVFGDVIPSKKGTVFGLLDPEDGGATDMALRSCQALLHRVLCSSFMAYKSVKSIKVGVTTKLSLVGLYLTCEVVNLYPANVEYMVSC